MIMLSGKTRGAQAGFSLTEMLVVLAVMAIVAGTLGVSLRQRGHHRDVEDLTMDIANVLHQARMHAIARSRQESVMFHPIERMIFYPQQTPAIALPENVTLTLHVGRELVLEAKAAELIFLPDGSASGAEIILSDGKDSATVKIPWLTGVPSISRER